MKKALVIALKDDTIRILQANLPRHEFDVIVAQTRTEALNKLRLVEPDLIILDTENPVIEANELRKVLDESPRTVDTQLVVVGFNINL